MKQPDLYRDIIARIEEVRTSLKINKSRFSADIGMKPQTYNNFIGAQASKPNVDLIAGVCRVYNVYPEWILSGAGPMFSDKSQQPEPDKPRVYKVSATVDVRAITGHAARDEAMAKFSNLANPEVLWSVQ